MKALAPDPPETHHLGSFVLDMDTHDFCSFSFIQCHSFVVVVAVAALAVGAMRICHSA